MKPWSIDEELSKRDAIIPSHITISELSNYAKIFAERNQISYYDVKVTDYDQQLYLTYDRKQV